MQYVGSLVIRFNILHTKFYFICLAYISHASDWGFYLDLWRDTHIYTFITTIIVNQGTLSTMYSCIMSVECLFEYVMYEGPTGNQFYY